MRVTFFASDKPRERLLADAFLRGVRQHGDKGGVRLLDGTPQVADDSEVAVMVGVKSREIYEANWQAGVHVLMLDKGYMRFRKGGPVKAWEYWRVAVDGHHPTRTLMATPRASDRMRAQMQRAELSLEPWRKAGEHIVIAGSSAKYHAFYGLPEPTEYAEELVRQLQRITGRPIVYRPKPSWRGAVPIGGARYSPRDEGIEDVLSGAHVLVTHGSNACFEAVISGVPCIVLGDAVAKPISSQNLREIEMPYLATDEERDQWLANLGWCQWTLREFADGDAWAAIRPQIYG